MEKWTVKGVGNMNKDEKIQKILNRLGEINSEKRPFIKTEPLKLEKTQKLMSVSEFKKYKDLCDEERKLLADLEKLES